MNTAEQKSAIRTEVRSRLRLVTPDQRAKWSTEIVTSLSGSPAWATSKSVLLFWPLNDEPDVSRLLEIAGAEGKITALPRFVTATGTYEAAMVHDPAKDLVTGRFGVREPGPHCPSLPLNQLDLVLVPGIAFDAVGCRLGRGKGYYDQLLAAIRGSKCGVALDCQLVASIPEESHDVRLNFLVTPTRWLEFSAAPQS